MTSENYHVIYIIYMPYISVSNLVNYTCDFNLHTKHVV